MDKRKPVASGCKTLANTGKQQQRDDATRRYWAI